MICEVILSSDEEDPEIPITKGVVCQGVSNSQLPLRKLQIQEPYTNKNGLLALKSYRNEDSSSSVCKIIDVRSLAKENPCSSTGNNNYHHQRQQGEVKGPSSSAKSIEESIESCIKKFSSGPLTCTKESKEKGHAEIEIGNSGDDPTKSFQMGLSNGTTAEESTNSLLFSEFIKKCLTMEDNPDDRKKAEDKLRSDYEKARKEYLESHQFSEIIRLQMEKLNRDTLYNCIRDIRETLKLNKPYRRVSLQPCTSSITEGKLVDSSSRIKICDDGLLKIDVSNTKDGEKVAKLQNALEILKRKIKVLEEADVDLDDEEDSAYLKMQRYRERFSQIYAELSNLTDVPKHACRVSKRRIRFAGTKYREVNVLIEKWLNKAGTFPDFTDIVDILKSLNLGFSQIQLQNIAQDAFIAIGDHLQKRRKLELWDILAQQYPVDEDPALGDSALSSKLEENYRRFRKQEQELFDAYVEKQISKKENASSLDSESDAGKTDNGEELSDEEAGSLNEGSDCKSGIEDMTTDEVTGAAAAEPLWSLAKRLRAASPEPPHQTNHLPTQTAATESTRSQDRIPDKNFVNHLNFFTVESSLSVPLFKRIFGNCYGEVKHFKKRNNANMKWGKSLKCKRPYLPLKKEVVLKLLRQSWNHLARSRHGSVTTGQSSLATSEKGSNSSSHSIGPEQSTGQNSSPNGGASGDDDDDEDKSGNKNVGNGVSNEPEEEQEENEESKEIDEAEKEMQEEVREESEENMLEKGDQQTDRQEGNEDLNGANGERSGQEPSPECNENEPYCEVEAKKAVPEEKGMQLRTRVASGWKPKWIDNGEKSESGSSDESEEHDSVHSDPDFSLPQEKKMQNVSKSVECSSLESSSTATFSNDCDAGIKLEGKVSTHSQEDEKPRKPDCLPATNASPADDDDDEIEVISENIVRKPSTITPQDRVSSFLANASKNDITVTRKRPMSRETKEALTQLKKLKCINISSSRSEVMVVNDRSSGGTSGLVNRRRIAVANTNLNRQIHATSNRLLTPPSVASSARQLVSRRGLPVISNVQSVRNTPPMITGVRGAGGSRGRAMPMPRMSTRPGHRGLMGHSRGPRSVQPLVRPNLLQVSSLPTRRGLLQVSSRGRGGRGRGMVPSMPRPPTSSVPFVLLD